jgi:hypothetical protein
MICSIPRPRCHRQIGSPVTPNIAALSTPSMTVPPDPLTDYDVDGERPSL